MMPADISSSSEEHKSWRDWLRVHPVAEQFDLLNKDELGALVADITRYGLREPTSYVRDKDGPLLLDGRNRLDALELAGRTITPDKLSDRAIFEQLGNQIDAASYIVSKNIHRRHLTPEKKQDIIRALLHANPTKSDRAIATAAKTHHHAVAKVRQEEEGRGNISHVETRTDTRGRGQPASKPKPVLNRVPRLVGDWTHAVGPPADGSKYVTVVTMAAPTTVVPIKVEMPAKKPVDQTDAFNEAAAKAAKALIDEGNALHQELIGFQETFAKKLTAWVDRPGLKDEARGIIARELRECACEFNRLADIVQIETHK